MADITHIYKATVKSVRMRLKTQGELPSNENKAKSQMTEFTKRAKDSVEVISKLKLMLQTNRKAYLNTTGYLRMSNESMNDAERDRLDTEAETCIQSCRDIISQFKEFAEHQCTSDSERTSHQEYVIQHIENYLQDVCKIYTEQRAIRVKRVVDRKRATRLEPDPASSPRNLSPRNPIRSASFSPKATIVTTDSINSSATPSSKSTNASPSNSENLIPDISFSKDLPKNLSPIIKSSTKASPANGELRNRNSGAASPLLWEEMPAENVSLEEEQELAMENESIFADMASMAEEVRQIEGRVVEISQLQEVFTEKVLQQEGDIERIASTAVASTENIKDASMNIREAMKNNAGLRFWILFIIIVMTLTLLFLDWYNP